LIWGGRTERLFAGRGGERSGNALYKAKEKACSRRYIEEGMGVRTDRRVKEVILGSFEKLFLDSPMGKLVVVFEKTAKRSKTKKQKKGGGRSN